MVKIIGLVLLCIPFLVQAKPACDTSKSQSSWDDCYGVTDSYRGEWKSGLMHGDGVLKYENDDFYFGQFRVGFPDGLGLLTYKAKNFSNRSRFEYLSYKTGTFRRGKLVNAFLSPDLQKTLQKLLDKEFRYLWDHHEARAKLIAAIEGSPSQVSGAAEQNFYASPTRGLPDFPANPRELPFCSSSVATETWTDCWGRRIFAFSTYLGEFEDGRYHGWGSIEEVTPNKSTSSYQGEWRNGLRDGYGIEVRTNGDIFEGQFTEGNPNGRGALTRGSDGGVLFGFWSGHALVRSEAIDINTLRDRTYFNKSKRVVAISYDSGNIYSQPTQLTRESLPNNESQTDQGAVLRERRVALVIGNAAYKSAPLDNPLNDATDIANELKRRGFKVISRNNANLRSLQQAVRDFSDEFKKSDVGLIYYSGHGVETKGQNYLIPVDADIKKEYELSAQAYPASQLTEMMEEVQSSDDKKRVAILILDACRDNPLTRSWRSSGRGLARMDAPAGTFISFSTSPGSVASDGRGRNSPFTKHLLQAMRKPDVPIELMFKEVRVGVMGETKGEQIPWDSSSLTGDFYFSRSIRDNPN